MNERGLIGTCQKMCPPSEIRGRQPNPFECDLKGKFRPELAIKQFHRSDAGKLISAQDIRPLPVLVKTIDHILHYVIGQKTNTSNETTEIQMYYFVRDRLRSIRTDITVQNLKGAETIQILQTSCLFFIWAGTRFHMEDKDIFDFKQNLEQITQSILSLNQLYDAYLIDNHKNYPSEAFFRAIDLISYLNYPGYMSKLLSLSDGIINSNYVQAVIETRKAILTRNISLLLSILDRVPIQMASYILQNSRIIWENIGFTLRRSFSQFAFPITYLTDFLKIPKKVFEIWCQSFALSKKPDQKTISYNIKAQLKMTSLPSVIVPDIFQKNQKINDILSFLNLEGNIGSFGVNAFNNAPKIEVPILPSSSSENESDLNEQEKDHIDTKKETAQPAAIENPNEVIDDENFNEFNSDQQLAVPIKKVKIVQEENIPMTPPEPDINDSNVNVSVFLDETNSDPHFPKFIPNRPNSTNLKLFKKDGARVNINSRCISKKNLISSNPDYFEAKISIKEIMAMIPYKIPRMSHVCVLLIADDNSNSSNLALERFITKNGNDSDTILCEKLTSSLEKCYILITKNQNQIGVTSVLDCNDTKDFGIGDDFDSSEKIPIIKYNYGYGFSPILTFNSCLRKAIANGITEIKPFNLSDLVQSTFSTFLRSISYTSWQFASANAVFRLLNLGLVTISTMLIDDSFTRFILPFEHNELDFSELKQYSAKIKSMQFKLMDNALSRRPISGSNWPSYIKDRINTAFPPFIIPLSAKFDQDRFISDILKELPYQEPSETIFYI